MTSAASLQAQTAARRRELEQSVAELRERLSPSQLSNNVGSALTSRVSAAADVIGEKAATPLGVVALSAMAFSSAFAMTGALPKNRDELDALAPLQAPRAPALSSPPRGDVALMLVQLSAAVAAGAVISRFIPVTAAEKTILDGVGPELRRTLQARITEGAQQLVAPQEGTRYGVANLLAMGGALLLSRKRARAG